MKETIRPEDELRLSHARFSSLSNRERDRIAKRHGHTIQSFGALLKKAEAGAKAFEVAKNARYEQEAIQRRKMGSKMPPHAVSRINAMRASHGQFRDAHVLEGRSLRLLETHGGRDEAIQLMRRAHRVFVFHRFAVLCRSRAPEEALRQLYSEHYVMLRRSNHPLLSDALEVARNELSAFVRSIRTESKRWEGSLDVDVTGPGEKFSTHSVQGWPGNGRSPHRKNDELEGY